MRSLLELSFGSAGTGGDGVPIGEAGRAGCSCSWHGGLWRGGLWPGGLWPGVTRFLKVNVGVSGRLGSRRKSPQLDQRPLIGSQASD